MRFQIKPYLTTTKYISFETDNVKDKNYYWAFEIIPKASVSRAQVAKWFFINYPNIKVKKIHLIKSFKKNKVILLCDTIAPWAQQ